MARKKTAKKPKKKKSSLKKAKPSARRPLARRTKKVSKLLKKAEIRLKKKIKRIKPRVKPKKIRKKASSPIADPTVHKTRIRVIGIGGGGSTIVSEITHRVRKTDFYVANTDSQALKESSRLAKRFQFGQNLTQGLGTGMNVELGERAAQEEKEKIEKILEGQDLCILISCLGGGTSSGAAPVFASISRKLGNITYGIFTLPFEFEGEKKMEAALEALEKIRPHLNVCTIVPNERIFQFVDKNAALREALSAINQRLADNLEGLIEMIYLPGLINIDFADLKTILSGRGRLTYLSTTEIEEIDKEEIEKKLISNPLYSYTLKGAKGILYNISSGKNIQLSEVSRISNIISASLNRKAKIIFGINQNQKYKNKIRITLLATGCSTKGVLAAKPKKSKPKKKIEPEKPAEPAVERKTKPARPRPSKKRAPKQVEKKPRKKAVAKKTKPRPKKPSSLPAREKARKIRPVVVKEVKPQAQEPARASEEAKIRKNALQVKKETDQAEKELLEQENIWEIPAILRKKHQ